MKLDLTAITRDDIMHQEGDDLNRPTDGHAPTGLTNKRKCLILRVLAM
jgi:hypothetical protein